MHAPALITHWRRLPRLQRRHLMLALGGTLLSWLLALLMACTSAPVAVPLYKRLGGPQGIDAITSRVLDRVASDPRSSHSFDGIRMSFLKRNVSAYLCKVADGPCVYEGETMAHAHAQSHIGANEFDLMVTVLREELDRANVRDDAKNELLRRLAPTKREIVQP